MMTCYRATALRCLLMVATLCLAARPVSGQLLFDLWSIAPPGGMHQPMRVGTEVVELFETNHPYSFWGPVDLEPQLLWSEEIYSPGASYICPHFSRFELAEGDFVVVRSPDGARSWRYDGQGKGRLGVTDGFWAIHIPGDTAIIELWGAGPDGAYGFTIDRYARGFPAEQEERPLGSPKNICGVDDAEWAKCYTTSEPTIYSKSRAVARLLIDGVWACTGWLVGSEGHLMTNNHCIAAQSSASNTNFEFMAEGATCATSCDSWGACPGTVVATSSTLVQTSVPNDYSLLELPTNPTGSYGFFQLRKEGGVADERIYLPMHPSHWGKRIAVFSDAANDQSGYTELYTKVNNGETLVWLYFADSLGGSSGSPVVAYSDHMVVALHHAAYEPTCQNWGNGGPIVEMLISDLGSNLPENSVIYNLGVSLTGAGTGSVSSSPSGISCPGDCTEDYGNKTVITLTPSPDAGSVFSGWSGDADCSDGQVTLDGDSTCTATFGLEGQSHTLQVSMAGDGTGTVTSSPAGISCPGDCNDDYDYGQVVTLTPAAATGSVFAGWSGDADCSDGVVTMNSAVSCTATFGVETHTLAVTMAGEGEGYVISTPDGIVCPGDCSEDYDYGQLVTLSPIATTGSDFAGWSGNADCSDGVVTMNTAVSCTATFTLQTHPLAVEMLGVGEGSVTSTPVGIDCPEDCDESYDHGQVVTLAQVAATGSDFAGWFGDEDCSDGVVTMDSAKACSAMFLLETRTLGVATAGTGSGTVTSLPQGVSCPGDCGEDYDYGQVVTLTPAAATGSDFVGWSGDADCTDGVVTMTANLSCTATFDLQTLTLGVTTAGIGSGTVMSSPTGISCPGDCTEDYNYGQVVTLTPAAGIGSVFAGWGGDADCSDGVVTMTVAVSCTATFDPNLNADMSLTMDNGRCVVDEDNVLTYTIVVANEGPGHAPGAAVEDLFPAELTDCRWTCDAMGGASCTAGPIVGDLEDTADLPVSSSVVYTAVCSVAEGEEDTLILNPATVSVPDGMTDPDETDNSDTASNYCREFLFADDFESGDFEPWSEVAGN